MADGLSPAQAKHLESELDRLEEGSQALLREGPSPVPEEAEEGTAEHAGGPANSQVRSAPEPWVLSRRRWGWSLGVLGPQRFDALAPGRRPPP